MMRVSTALLLGVYMCLVAAVAHSQSPADSAYTEVFYPSGSLRIHAFLYKPNGDGPFPIVIYNHGARTGRPRRPEPNEYIGRLLTRAGYVVLIPERRGYGDSDGPTLSDDIGNDGGSGSLHGWRRRPMMCLLQSVTFGHCRSPITNGSVSWATR